MEKTRVPKGERYWCIRIVLGLIEIVSYIDNYHCCDNKAYESGNYYLDKDEAKNDERKLRAVLKGADVIEMPSEEEISKQCDSSAHEMDIDDGETPNSGLYWGGWWNAVRWLKSKIVK